MYLSLLISAYLLAQGGKSLDGVVVQPTQAPISSASELEDRYRFFSELCRQAPTLFQTEILAEAEKIYQLLHGFRTAPATQEEIQDLCKETEAFALRLDEEYPFLRLEWRDDKLISQDMPSVPLAMCVPRCLIVSIENATDRVTCVRLNVQDSLLQASPAYEIPPGQCRLFPVALLAVSRNMDHLTLDLLPVSGVNALFSIELPVVVSVPAIIIGELWDSDKGVVFPGKVTVRCSDGILRHGRAFADNPTLSEKPVVFRPAWRKLPFFYSDGHFEIQVPPGETEISMERGFEFRVIRETVNLKPGEKRDIRLKSGRFLDMAERHWISGDTHVHWTKNSWDENEDMELLKMVQRAEDVRVINNLTLYQWRPQGAFIKPDSFPMGPVPGACDAEYHIQMAEEYRNDNHYGHINLLNIQKIIQPIATGQGSGGDEKAIDYPLNRTAILEARQQGGISIEAHGLGPFHCSDVPANVIQGLTDSLDQIAPEHYYKFLDAGLQIPLTDGSDHPARVVGCVRAYVKVDNDFSYESWIQGIRQGHTFVTSGPLLFLEVNGAEAGNSLQVRQGDRLRISAQAFSRHPLGTLQILSNSEILKSEQVSGLNGKIRVTVKADKGQWFIARCSASESFDPLEAPDVAHTSSVFVYVDGQGPFDRKAVDFWTTNLQQHMERVQKLGRYENDSQRQEELDYIQSSIEKYQGLLSP